MKNRINELTEETNELNGRISQYKHSNDSLKTQNLEYVSKLEACISDLKKLKLNTQKKEQIIQELSKKLESAYETNEELSTRVQELDSQVDALNEEVSSIQNVNTDSK